MKKLLFCLMTLACQTLAFADGSALLITFTDGTTASYVLSEKPRVTFGQGTLLITSAGASAEYERATISRFTFVDAAELGIGPLTEGSMVFEYDGTTVRMAGAPIEVFTTGGTLIVRGTGSVSLSSQPSGIYVVRSGRHTVKVVKK